MPLGLLLSLSLNFFFCCLYLCVMFVSFLFVHSHVLFLKQRQRRHRGAPVYADRLTPHPVQAHKSADDVCISSLQVCITLKCFWLLTDYESFYKQEYTISNLKVSHPFYITTFMSVSVFFFLICG